MLKLKWQHRLRLVLWQQRRLLILSGASLLAVFLILLCNHLLLNITAALPVQALALLALAQLSTAGLLVLLVLIVSD